MSNHQLPLERAFDLARSGRCLSIGDIKNHLKSEGIATDQISGGSLLRQLRQIIKEASAPQSN